MTNSDIQNHAVFQIGLKAMIWKDGKFLLLRHNPSGRLDLPGGRINIDEKDTNLMEVLDREIREELGEEFKVKVGVPLFQFRRNFLDRGYAVFITVYEAHYLAGEIIVSEDHQGMEWIDPSKWEFVLEDFFHQDEYEAFKKYFRG